MFIVHSPHRKSTNDWPEVFRQAAVNRLFQCLNFVTIVRIFVTGKNYRSQDEHPNLSFRLTYHMYSQISAVDNCFISLLFSA